MNQKTAKKIRKMLRAAVVAQDTSTTETTAPGVVEVVKKQVPTVAYTETQKNRKPMTKQVADDAEDGTYDYQTNGKKFKVVGVSRGTMVIQPGTIRGTYLALKDGYKKHQARP